MPRMIQIRHVPDEVHAALKARAAREGMSLSDFLLREVAAISLRPSWDDVIARIRRRGPISITESAADAVRAERDAR